jgi:predicted HD superfamily hydrolase involved in NAD metabolism
MKTVPQILEIIRLSVSDGRYAHILRVADTAKRLAMHWGLDAERAYLGGIIHDAAKQLSPALLRDSGVVLEDYLDEVYDVYPKVWHALIIDQYARVVFDIQDDAILESAKWHTTGHARMSELAKVIFVADYIEPGREVKPRAYMEEVAYRNLDHAVFGLSMVSLYQLLAKGGVFHPYTVECRNAFLMEMDHVDVIAISRQIKAFF